jgi:WD40 repeat protein
VNEQNRCPQCGSDLLPSAPHGLCPQCLMKAGLSGGAGPVEPSPTIEGPGGQIGRYELLELIGEGGMGLVYKARQTEPIERIVALKIVKLGMDTLQVVARFRAEQQTLALLDHPNIARVFDAGTTDSGRPYFVMEYVPGQSITEYCDTHTLGIEQRLELFAQACRAIQHAHQKGVLHRDIKPSNILVHPQGHSPILKVIDFGIAKAITEPLGERTALTEQGQLLGTPEYMSPEQADLAYGKIDTRSDVYSLGVVLYELLAGAPPFAGNGLREGGIEQIRQIIRDEEPKTPSARLTALGEKAKEVAAMRRTQILTLIRRLKSELEWIPLKAMRKEPEQRYQSVSDLAQDISNYLAGTALLAGPQSRLYRTRKFMRKHAGSVMTVALVCIALVLGLLASTAMAYRADRARAAVQEQSDEYRKLFYVHCVAQADTKYREHNLRSARKLLESCPEDLRNWEWHRLDYVTDEADSAFGQAPKGQSFLALSPDGQRWVGGTIRTSDLTVWDLESQRKVQTLRGHKMPPWCVVFSPDGRRIVTGGYDQTLKIWDANSGAEIMTLTGHEGPIQSVAISPDGRRIASGGRDKTIRVWDATTGQEVRTLTGHEDIVCAVAFSPDGSKIASGGYDKTLRIWDAATGEQLKLFPVNDQKIISLAYNPDGRNVIAGCGQGMIKRLDVETGEGTVLTAGQGWEESLVTVVAYSPDGKLIASGGYDQIVRVWDVTTGEEVETFVGHASAVVRLAFTPDGRRIVSGAPAHEMRVWDLGTDRERTILGTHQGLVHQLAFTADGRRLVSCSRDHTIKIWDVPGTREIRTLRGHTDAVVKVAVSPDGKRIASASIDQTLRIWDADTGRELRKLTGHHGPVYSVAYSPDGTRIASGGTKMVRVWDASTGEELLTLAGHSENCAIHSVAFSPDGKRLVSTGGDATIRIWDALRGRELRTLRGHGKRVVCNALFTPDGGRIVSGAYDGTVRIWDDNTGDLLMTLVGHKQHNIESLAISPDGTRIVSASFSSVKLWDAETGAELMTVSAGHSTHALAFSPDGKIIAAGTSDEGSGYRVILWRSGPRPASGQTAKAPSHTME